MNRAPAAGFAARVLLALAALAVPAFGALRGQEYVIISQPKKSSIVYIQLDLFKNGVTVKENAFISSGLDSPFGLAIDANRQRLFVADPVMAKVFMYKLIFADGVLTTDGQQYVAISGLSPRWVSVDEAGNVYCTDENTNEIAKVTKEELQQSLTVPTTVYSASSVGGVSTPGGIVCDGSHIFWGNKMNGGTKGSVIRAKEVPDPTDVSGSTFTLATNAPKVYGVCASQNNVFYAGDAEYLYGVKKNAQTAGEAAVVSDILVQPRGCAWDGDGTVYVADRGGGKIYSFPSAMHTITAAEITVAHDGIEDPFGIAVYRPKTESAQKETEQFLGVGALGGAMGARAVLALALPLLAAVLGRGGPSS